MKRFPNNKITGLKYGIFSYNKHFKKPVVIFLPPAADASIIFLVILLGEIYYLSSQSLISVVEHLLMCPFIHLVYIIEYLLLTILHAEHTVVYKQIKFLRS